MKPSGFLFLWFHVYIGLCQARSVLVAILIIPFAVGIILGSQSLHIHHIGAALAQTLQLFRGVIYQAAVVPHAAASLIARCCNQAHHSNRYCCNNSSCCSMGIKLSLHQSKNQQSVLRQYYGSGKSSSPRRLPSKIR